MAGKPGVSGGARPGAGRPKGSKNAPRTLDIGPHEDPLAFLLTVMNDPAVDAGLRVRAAVAAAQYTHAKVGEGSKKDARSEAARAAAGGKFAQPAPPKLVVVGNQ